MGRSTATRVETAARIAYWPWAFVKPSSPA
jgi:hypothetical protein